MDENKVSRRFFNGPLHSRDLMVCEFVTEIQYGMYKYKLCKKRGVMVFNMNENINIVI